MKWEQLLCEKRQTKSKYQSKKDLRNEFQKDYHRIICSASFRRLQDKTQVFPLDKSDFVRTRLTHSLEVSSFAKSLGQTALDRFSEDPTEAYRIIADASKPFYRSFHIEIVPTYSNIGSLKLNACPNGYINQCTTLNCGSTCQNRINSPNHHKNFDYNALNAWNSISRGNNRLRIILVGADLCHNSNGNHSTGALGWWPGAGTGTDGSNGMVEQNRGHMLDVRVVQHELSHAFGTHHCTSTTTPCIMNSGFDSNYQYNLYSIWCSSCKKDFNRNI